MYSNPPSHGARIVSYVLNNAHLYEQWKECIRTMSSRIIKMRTALKEALIRLGTPGNWDHITTQIGMFSYTGLNGEYLIELKKENCMIFFLCILLKLFSEQQSVHMVEKHHVYMLKSGRISMCGLTPSNVEYVAKAIHETLLSNPM